MKKLLKWMNEGKSIALGALPGSWAIALFMGSYEEFYNGVTLDALGAFAIDIVAAYCIYMAVMIAPWMMRTDETESARKIKNWEFLAGTIAIFGFITGKLAGLI